MSLGSVSKSIPFFEVATLECCLVAAREASGVRVSHDYAKELTEPHIASPDVHVDEENQRIIMYFHGLEAAASSASRSSAIGGRATAKNESSIGRLPGT